MLQPHESERYDQLAAIAAGGSVFVSANALQDALRIIQDVSSRESSWRRAHEDEKKLRLSVEARVQDALEALHDE